MKIIQLVDSRNVGGIETHIHILSKVLIRNKQSVTVVFTKDYGDHDLEKKLQEDNIPYCKLDGSIFSLKNFLKKENPDILHTHGYKAGVIGKIVGFFMMLKVVSTYHSGDPGTGKVKLYTLLDNILSPLCSPLAISQEIAERVLTKAHIVKNFVDIPRSPYNKNKITSIGFVGRLSHEKGPDLYVEIAKLFSSIKFHIFGDGVMREQLELTAPSNCVFHGHVDDMNKAWKEIDMLCMPSRREGLPMAALEAMAIGVPVLASDVGALPYLINSYDNGFISKVGDIDDFQEKIALWIECGSSKRSQMSQTAHNTIKKNFNADHEIRNMISVYQCLHEGYRH